LNTRALAGVLIAAAAALPVADAIAQEYPTRPIRMIVPFAPAGPTDIIGRLIAPYLSEALKQQVVVDNRGGAGGNIGMGLVATAAPDGHTILLVSSSFVVNPGLYSKIPYDPYRSFIPVSNLAASPNVFLTYPGLPMKSMDDVMKAIKADPKKYSFATPGIGTTPDLSARLFTLTAKVDVATIPYGGAGPALAAIVANQVPLGCGGLRWGGLHTPAGRLRPIALTSAKRNATLPDVPTMAEAGFPGQEADTLQGMLVPAGTPQAVVKRLHSEVVKVLGQPTVKERVLTLGYDIVASSPEEFAKQIKAEVAKWTSVVKQAGIKVD
jgi:tripartite-type tricarboxylate transporter receptor subunit TctC